MLAALADIDLRARAVDTLHRAVDRARAVWRGQVLVGHRRSIQAGHMFWALPGRDFANGQALRQDDPAFHVIAAPTTEWLVEQQPILKELTQ